ncbi:MAG: hypothetical protein RBS29_05400 [Bacteroidales bacterium]|nr:hypothetical protein [Bacteroidales bacterium]
MVKGKKSGLSLQACSEVHHISIQTAFDWRHKVLSSLRNYIPTQYHCVPFISTFSILDNKCSVTCFSSSSLAFCLNISGVPL